jgi:predicted ATPase/DNA-binding SARP family transcriptional activator
MPRLRVLGPVELVAPDGRPVPLGARERTLTAALALERGRVVSNDRLIDALWPERQPTNALNVLRNVVLRLRKAIAGWEAVRVEGAPHGYVLTCPEPEVDAAQAELLAADARSKAADGDWARCVALLDEALALFRGDAFTGYDELDGVLPERARIAELGVRIAEERVEGLLELGMAADAALSLELLCPANPLRERPWLQHMVALHRLGRDAAALDVGRRYRDKLRAELGLDPSPEWHELQQRILRQDPQLRRTAADLPAGEVTFLRVALIDDEVTTTRDGGGGALELVTAFAGAVTAYGGAVTERALASLAAAFSTPASALAAGRAMCRIASDRPGGSGLAPRVGVHLGTACTPVHGQYLTPEARLADRVAAAAQPGQVLLTGSAAVPSEQAGGPGRLRHLGAFHLIGSESPVDLWEVEDGQPARQPRAVAALRHNLPTFSSDLIGREEERDEIVALVTAPGVVSLVGPGGVGKTRLAVEAALRRVGRGNVTAVFVALAPVAGDSLVDAAFADAFGLRASGPGLVSAIAHELTSRDVLLVADNCEHVSRKVAELLLDIRRQSPGTSILVTSREPLGVDGEVVWRLAPLDVPPRHTPLLAQPMLEYAAVRMFAARAHAADRTFALDDDNAGMVGEAVRALDGLPLALELAASLVGSLGLVELWRGLEYRLDLLDTARPGVDPRHQVLRATLDWSHDLLSDRERSLYRRLAVFTAPVDVDAIGAVCADETLPMPLLRGALARLVERSLVMREDAPAGVRFSLLETMKVHAGAELGSAPELEDVRRRHAAWVIDSAERVSSDPVLAYAERFDRVHALRSDIRAALTFLLDHDPGSALRLITGSRLRWDWMSRWGDAVELVDRALAGAGGGDPADRAAAYQIQGFALLFHDLPAAAEALGKAAELFEELGQPDDQGIALQRLASATADRGDLPAARRIAERAMEVKRRTRTRV